MGTGLVLAVVALSIVGGLGLLGLHAAPVRTPDPAFGSEHPYVLQGGVYDVNYTETGLPVGTFWGVTDNGYTQYATVPSIVFADSNGSDTYSITGVAGYTTEWYGSLTINGANVSVPVSFVPMTYSIVINETGLPARTDWAASVDGLPGSTNTPSLTFSEPNGTYNYSIRPVTGYAMTNGSGNVTVDAANTSVEVDFSPQVDYSVAFNETGLPAGTDWTVSIGSDHASSTLGSLALAEPNGTYTWTITPIAGYLTNWTGDVTVAGSNVSVSVPFTQALYALHFAETGLPSGTSWTVTIGGSGTSSTTASVRVLEPNGTYSWAITPIAGYSTTWDGSSTVAGANVTIPVDFSEFAYAVTFTETGLAPSTKWQVTIGAVSEDSTSASVVLSEPNGTFAWTIGRVTGYTTTWSGNVTVDAGPVTVDVGFTEVNYSLIFLEHELPTGTDWTVSVGSDARSSTGAEIAFVEPDGTYAWSVTPIPGYTTSWSGSSTIYGADLLVNVTFTPVTYPIAFAETGLPSGTTWGVSVGGSPVYGRTATLTALEPNGTYSYTVLPVAGFLPTVASGSVTVIGAGRSVSVVFQAVEYTVTFSETGLPSGTTWSVAFNGGPASVGSGPISFSAANGTYPYVVASIPGFTTARSGQVVVNGADQAVTVPFVPFVSTVTFAPIGLPDGTGWGVDLAGKTLTGAGGPIAFPEANGTYSYTVSAVPGYTTTWTGTVKVQGVAVTVSVPFVPFDYAIGFLESGLPTGTAWAVSIGGQSAGPAAGPLSLLEPNGTYAYAVLPVPGYTALWSGVVTVDGSAPTVPIAFQPATYAQTFRETGLPAGTNWSVTITASGGSGGTVTVWSNGASAIVYSLANGTYTYATNVPGFRSVSGTLGVSGATPAVVTVPMASTGSASASLGAPLWLLATLAGVAVVVLALVLLLWARRRGGKPAPAPRTSPDDEPSSGEERPPSTASP
jgi:hypothetical protein